MSAEAAEAARPVQFTRLARGIAEGAAPETCPGDEGRAAAPAAIETMAMGDVVGPARGLIAHSAAQATAMEYICCWHGGRYARFTRW